MKLPEKGITGIYKITNPKGRVYIGQSKCIRRRWIQYKKPSISVKSQNLLYNSLMKYSSEKHKFEIIATCKPEELNEMEYYYQKLFNVIDRSKGLNLVMQDPESQNLICSDESRERRSRAIKGKYKGSKHYCYKLVLAKNLITKEIIEMGVSEMASFMGTSRCVIRRKCEYYSYTERSLKDWDFSFKDSKKEKKIELGKLSVILDTQTGVFYYGSKDIAEYLGITKGCFEHRLRDNIEYKERYLNTGNE